MDLLKLVKITRVENTTTVWNVIFEIETHHVQSACHSQASAAWHKYKSGGHFPTNSGLRETVKSWSKAENSFFLCLFLFSHVFSRNFQMFKSLLRIYWKALPDKVALNLKAKGSWCYQIPWPKKNMNFRSHNVSLKENQENLYLYIYQFKCKCLLIFEWTAAEKGTILCGIWYWCIIWL